MLGKKSVVIALGYFDSVHRGHQKVLSVALKSAKESNVLPAVFTFRGNLNASIGKGDKSTVFNYSERKSLINGLGIKEIFFAPTTKQFLSLDKKEFLDLINDRYNVLGYVCGEDYKFGKNGQGDTEYLKKYAKSHNQTVTVVKLLTSKGEKISTSKIKEYLQSGNIKTAKDFLGFDYFYTGKVVKGRSVGKTLGFPTANINVSKSKSKLKCGVYYGKVYIDKEYKAVINYGAKPTFSVKDKTIEIHIVGYNGDLYGKKLQVSFIEYLREIQRFDSVLSLKEALKRDLQSVKGKTL